MAERKLGGPVASSLVRCERPEILTERLTWMPEGANTPFSLDLPEFFARVRGDDDEADALTL